MLQDLFVDDLLGDPQNIETIEDEAHYLEGDENSDGGVNERDEDNDEDAVTPIQTEPTGEAVEAKKKRNVRPRPKLNPDRLKGARGIALLEDVFKDFKYCGKGHEQEDLNQVMKRLEHWAHRLFPRFQFDDCLHKIETLGNKKPVMTYVKKIRMGMVTADDALILPDEDEIIDDIDTEPPIDAFDALISQQLSQIQSSGRPSPPPAATQSSLTLSSEQRERMLQNRLLAEERKLARLKAQHEKEKTSNQASTVPIPIVERGDEEKSLPYPELLESVQNRTEDEPTAKLNSQYHERDNNDMSFSIVTSQATSFNNEQSPCVGHPEAIEEVGKPLDTFTAHQGRGVTSKPFSVVPADMSVVSKEQSSLFVESPESMQVTTAVDEPVILATDMNINCNDGLENNIQLSNHASSIEMEDNNREIDRLTVKDSSFDSNVNNTDI